MSVQILFFHHPLSCIALVRDMQGKNANEYHNATMMITGPPAQTSDNAQVKCIFYTLSRTSTFIVQNAYFDVLLLSGQFQDTGNRNNNSYH